MELRAFGALELRIFSTLVWLACIDCVENWLDHSAICEYDDIDDRDVRILLCIT